MSTIAATALSLTLLTGQPGAVAKPQEPEVRVRVKRSLSTVEISGMDLRIAPPSGVLAVAGERMGPAKAKITRSPKGYWRIKWADTEFTQRIQADRLLVRGQVMRIGPEPVPYHLEIVGNPQKGLDVVARMDIETYLTGVLPSEMPASWPLEALKAQAVASRSFALRMAQERRNRHFDVEATIFDQVYKFMHEAQEHPEYKTKINRALNETRGQVLVDSNDRVLKAFYSADCGCQSEDPKFVWGAVDDFTSVKDPTCERRSPLQWNLQLSRADVRERLIAALKLPADSRLRAVQVSGRTPSGRVANVTATLDVDGRARPHAMNAQEFRRIIGFDRVRSTDFSMQWSGEKLNIRGTGIGHGVGMCQTGASSFAKEGRSYKDILKFYYPKAQLRTPRQV